MIGPRSSPRFWHADGRFTRLDGAPCADYMAALAASWRVRSTSRDGQSAGLMHPDTTHRWRLLCVPLGFLGLDVPPGAMPPELRALHAWFDTWHGIGLIEPGLARPARDLSLTRYRDRWGASVSVTGMEHSIVQGSGWQTTPWEAVQQASFPALHRGRYWSTDLQVL